MANVKKEKGSNGGGMFSGIVIVLCIFVAALVWQFVMGNGSNFEGGARSTSEPVWRDPE